MKNGTVERGGGHGIDALNQKLDRYVEGWFPPANELNQKRCEILDRCMEQGEGQKPGLYTLTVPTGGGKTVASLAFALRHARANGLRRVIYVVPYTSIIEQTAETFCGILGAENVLEHHSGVIYDAEDLTSGEAMRLSYAAENWDMPVIVTTAVQFFESLFACRSSKCRKLHNIANSVVVFDEAQMLPLSYLMPCVYAISQLVLHYGVSAVLCTATQPALDPVIQRFMPDYVPQELCPSGLAADPVFQRTVIQRTGVLEWEAVAARMNQARQILCIVNSRKNAQTVFSMLHGEGCYHLSTLMVPADRAKKLDEIRMRLAAGLPCRVVSTSLIEAGVDVDFPEVMREEAGLDSVLQAAGRCNREGKRPLAESIVTVFRTATPAPALFATNIDTGRLAMERFQNPADMAAVRFYFQELRSLKGERAMDEYGILEKLGNGSFPFRTVAERFHFIKNAAVTIYVPVGDGHRLLERRKRGEISRLLMRQLGRYSVNVYDGHFQALYAAGDILPLDDGSYCLENTALYSPQTGLSLEADTGKAEFI